MIHPAEAAVLFSNLKSPEEGTKMWGHLFKEISKFPSTQQDGNRKGRLRYSNQFEEHNNKNHPLQIGLIDLRFEENNIMENQWKDLDTEIVLKFGRPFQLDLYFYRDYDPNIDELQFIFEPKECSTNEQTSYKIIIDLKKQTDLQNKLPPERNTFCNVINCLCEKMVVECQLSNDTNSSGLWNLKIRTGLKGNQLDACVYLVRGLYFVQ